MTDDMLFPGFPRPVYALCALGLCAALAACTAKPTVINAPEPTGTPAPSPVAAATVAPVVAPTTMVEASEQTTILSPTQDAGRSYLDETLFIGDSNTARYMMYADDTGTPFTTLQNNIGVVSMGAQSITTLKCEQFKGYSEMFTIPDAVAMLKPKRIIIGFGSNNLYGSSTDATKFISNYLQGLQAIQAKWPYADIIVNAIPPLDQQRDNTNLTMVQVDAYNSALAEMCEENGFYFLNSAETLRDDATGWAKKDYTLSDGVHLSKVAVTAFFDYVRTHALITEDRRPQPLGTIPEPNGSPVGLISSDPIAVRGAKVPVEFVVSGNGHLEGETSQQVKKGATCSTVTAVADKGWIFTGWTASYGSAAQTESLTFTVPSTADAGGVVLTAVFEPDAHEHEYIELRKHKVTGETVELTDDLTKEQRAELRAWVEPTCQTKGTAKYVCTICGETIEKKLDTVDHQWDDGVLKDGKLVYTCKVCHKTREEKAPATPTPVPSPTPTASPSATPTQTPSATPEPTAPPAATPTPAPTEPPATPPTPTVAPAPTEEPLPTAQPGTPETSG